MVILIIRFLQLDVDDRTKDVFESAYGRIDVAYTSEAKDEGVTDVLIGLNCRVS